MLDLNPFALEEVIKLIMLASQRLKCSVRTRCKALMIYHQFKRCIDEMKYDPYLVAAACLNLSVKSNEEDIELDAIMLAFFWILESSRKNILDPEFDGIKQSLMKMECIILRMIDFDLNHRLAHDYLVYFLFDRHEDLQKENYWYEIMEICLKIISDFYTSNRCLSYKAEEIASTSIHAAFCIVGFDIQNTHAHMETWLKHLKETPRKEEIFEDIYRICVISPEAERRSRSRV